MGMAEKEKAAYMTADKLNKFSVMPFRHCKGLISFEMFKRVILISHKLEIYTCNIDKVVSFSLQEVMGAKPRGHRLPTAYLNEHTRPQARHSPFSREE